MKNVTITLDEKVAKWARVRAAQLDTSVSRLVGDLLREMMAREQAYEIDMEKFLAITPVHLKEKGASYPERDELHAR
jgi:plasmid stability protein